MRWRDAIDDVRTTVVPCNCGGEGVVVFEWMPTDYDDGDIILSIWGDWHPFVWRWRVRMAWTALFGSPADLGTLGILLDCERARRLAGILNGAADELERAQKPNGARDAQDDPSPEG